ncbi:MAG: hypothetical protein ABII93_04890 [Chrysiogenia bacterium]
MSEMSPYKKPNFESKNILYISLSVAIIIIAFSFFYYNVIHKPRLEKIRIEVQKNEQEKRAELQLIDQENKIEQQRMELKKELEQQRMESESALLNKTKVESEISNSEAEYFKCKSNVQNLYELEWKKECENRGLSSSASLPRNVALVLGKNMQDRLNRCEREYKLKLETLKLKQALPTQIETVTNNVESGVPDNIRTLNPPDEKIEENKSMSIYEERRALGLERFEKEVIELAKKSDQMDIEYKRYKDACLNRSTYVHTYGRNWFSIWGGSVLINNESTPECLKIWSDFSRLAKEIKAGMEYSMELARKAGVYPGQVRKMREKYYMDWSGWD